MTREVALTVGEPVDIFLLRELGTNREEITDVADKIGYRGREVVLKSWYEWSQIISGITNRSAKLINTLENPCDKRKRKQAERNPIYKRKVNRAILQMKQRRLEEKKRNREDPPLSFRQDHDKAAQYISRLLQMGLSDREIAKELFVSKDFVRAIRRLYNLS